MSCLPTHILGHAETSSTFQAYLASLGEGTSTLERKDYLTPLPATSYRNLKACGLSFQFQRTVAAGQAEDEEAWRCTAIDIYNATALDRGAKRKCGYTAYPSYPLHLAAKLAPSSSSASNAADTQVSPTGSLEITPQTTARDFVLALGEPARKGGGEALAGGGASGLGPAVWMEWKVSLRGTKEGTEEKEKEVLLMVELAGDEARGAGRWEADKAGKATWGVLTLSMPDQ